MSTSVLTQQERDGLEDVFSSIHTKNCNYFKELVSGILAKKQSLSAVKFFKRPKWNLKKIYFARRKVRTKH